MTVPLLDLKAQYVGIRADVERAVLEVLESQQFILGPYVQQCERAVGAYVGSPHAIGVSSGSDALLVCLMAEGVGPGDEIITTPYTFFATVGSITRLGATPVFVDIDPVSYNIAAAQIEAKVTARTRGIIPVHLYGQSADMSGVMAVAERHGLFVLEDAAQAIGAEFENKRVGTIGDYGTYSFFPSKNLGAAGDGGMVVTNDSVRAEKLAILRAHGSKPKYYHRVVGGNFRLDALQGAVVSAKLPHLDAWTEGRRRNAARYDRLFAASGLRVNTTELWAAAGKGWQGPASPQIVLPSTVATRHIFNQYVVRVERRDALKASLEKDGIGTEVYYPVPMHLQDCLAFLGHRAGAFPESEGAANETLALPIYPELSDAQAEHVVQSVKKFFAGFGQGA